MDKFARFREQVKIEYAKRLRRAVATRSVDAAIRAMLWRAHQLEAVREREEAASATNPS